MRALVLPLVLTLGLAGCRPASERPAARNAADLPTRPAVLYDAVGELTDVMVHDILNPPQAARAYTYASVAAYEALVPGSPAYRPLAGQLDGLGPVPPPPEGVHYPLAGVEAFLKVAGMMVFSHEDIAAYRAEVHERFREAGLDRAAFERSVAYGEAVGAHVLAWADSDQYKQTRSMPAYAVGDDPGRWRPTPPAYIDGIEPNWVKIRPFVLDSAAEAPLAPPPPFSTAPGSPFMREVMEVAETGRNLTDEQREIANFWDCNPYKMNLQGHAMFATKKITPGGHWMGIAGQASRQAGDDLMGAAEAYVLTALALADGFLGTWCEKYRYCLVRPETVINQHVDPGWQPLLQTPPFPEYPSGHSAISAAAAEVLTARYGDGFAFADSTELRFGLPVRRFPSFRAAAEEAALSRLYGGIHYRAAIEEGMKQGRRVGALVVERVVTRRPALASTSTSSPTP